MTRTQVGTFISKQRHRNSARVNVRSSSSWDLPAIKSHSLTFGLGSSRLVTLIPCMLIGYVHICAYMCIYIYIYTHTYNEHELVTCSKSRTVLPRSWIRDTTSCCDKRMALFQKTWLKSVSPVTGRRRSNH